MSPDDSAKETFWNLVHEFGGMERMLVRNTPPLSPCTFGIEIEVPWRLYFPTLWKKYFQSGRKKYSDFSEEEKIEVTEECNALEKILLLKLKKTIECGIPRGCDKYWEFAFPPVNSIEIAVSIAEVLEHAKLLPFGEPLSLQVTVGGIRTTKNAYYALMVLETLYGSEDRIRSAIGKGSETKTTWARRGRAGIADKKPTSLAFGEKRGLEFRILELPGNVTGLYKLLSDVELLSSWLWREQIGAKIPEWSHIQLSLEKILERNGLPNRNWEVPQKNENLWLTFARNFSSIQQEVRTVFSSF